ncbi:MAG: hypothetical protein JWR09_5868 [Mucilaginibacter sp.]|nr:hypothetical protein [Mucilaginibacter sp.]
MVCPLASFVHSFILSSSIHCEAECSDLRAEKRWKEFAGSSSLWAAASARCSPDQTIRSSATLSFPVTLRRTDPLWASIAWRVGSTVGKLSGMVDYLRDARFVRQVDDAAGLPLDIHVHRGARRQSDPHQTEHEAASAVPDALGEAIEQLDLDVIGATAVARLRLTFRCISSVTSGRLSSRLRCSRLSPTVRAAPAMVLTSPATMASIALRTLWEMRRGDAAADVSGV